MENSRRVLAWGAIIFLTVSVRQYSTIIWSATFGHTTIHPGPQSAKASASLSVPESTGVNKSALSINSVRTASDVEKYNISNFNNSGNANREDFISSTATSSEEMNSEANRKKVSGGARTVTPQEELNAIMKSQEVTSLKKNTVDDLPGVPRICFLSCISSKGFRNMLFSNTALSAVLLKSIKSTIEPKYRYSLIIGIDKTDTFWNAHIQEIIDFFHSKPFIDVEILAVKGGSFSKAINGVAAYAHTLKTKINSKTEGKCNYYIRINDDSQFVSHGWTTMAVNQLAKYNPKNVGVVGPTVKQGNTGILVFDFVHRVHLDIFDTYYPAELSNWWIDDWITQVYRPNNMRKLPQWRMNHVMKHGRRYSVNRAERQKLSGLVKGGKESISKYSQSGNANNSFVTD
jgi:hypothetical protein